MKINITPMGAVRQNHSRWSQHTPKAERYHAYQNEIRLKLPAYQLGMSLDIKFYLPMPKSWSKKKRAEMVNTYHDQKPDIDNLAKGFMDAFGSEDKHVAILHAEKYWAEEGYIEIL